MTASRVRFVGPLSLAVTVATALADADGVDLVASQPPAVVDGDTVTLEVEVEGSPGSVSAAVDSVRDSLPAGASIELVDR